MNKTKALRIALILLPLLVVGIAVSPTAVTVIDGETLYTTSFMDPVEGSNGGWCAPVAALLNYGIFALAVLYCVTGKEFCLKGIFGVAFAAMFLAALPIVMEGTPKVIPNVLAAILFGVQCLLARVLQKTPAVQPASRGERLNKH